METKSQNHHIKLDTPCGKELIKNVASVLQLKLEMSEDHGVHFNIRFDEEKVQQFILQFLEASFLSHTIPYDPEILNSVIITSDYNPYDPKPVVYCGLTGIEFNIMDLLAQAKSDKEIAQSLNMRYFTVKTHIKKIFRKLEAKNRIDAVLKFLKGQGRLADISFDTMLALAKIGYVKNLN